MVCISPLVVEDVNVSLVRMNQGTSGHASVKASITKNLTATDKNVINASLLHPELLAQHKKDAEAKVPTVFWGDVGNNSSSDEEEQDGDDEASQQAHAMGEADSSSVTPAATTTSETPAVTLANVAPAASISSLVTEGVGRVASVTSNPAVGYSAQVGSKSPSANAPTISKQPDLRKVTIQMPTTANHIPTRVPLNGVKKICVSTGVKRSLEEHGDSNAPKLSKLTSGTASLNDKSQTERDNQELKKQNLLLRERNYELQEKLNLLNRLLMDPKKLNVLHARLQQLHKASA